MRRSAFTPPRPTWSCAQQCTPSSYTDQPPQTVSHQLDPAARLSVPTAQDNRFAQFNVRQTRQRPFWLNMRHQMQGLSQGIHLRLPCQRRPPPPASLHPHTPCPPSPATHATFLHCLLPAPLCLNAWPLGWRSSAQRNYTYISLTGCLQTHRCHQSVPLCDRKVPMDLRGH